MNRILVPVSILALLLSNSPLAIAQQSSETQTDLDKQVESILKIDSSGWLNTFDSGSVHDSTVESDPNDDDVQIVRATYGYAHGSEDWVKLRYRGGKFECLKFGTEFSDCRALNNPRDANPYAVAAVIATVAIAAGIAANASKPSEHTTPTYSQNILFSTNISGAYAGCEVGRRYQLTNGRYLICQSYSYGSSSYPIVQQTASGQVLINSMPVIATIQ